MKKSSYSLLLVWIVSLAVLVLKIHFATDGYRYINFGLDSARILAQINESIGTNNLPGDISPRLFLQFVGLFEAFLLGMPPEKLLLPVAWLFPVVALYFTYRIAQEFMPDRKVAPLAAILFALVIPVTPPNPATTYALILFPASFFFFLKFVRDRHSMIPLVILYLGSFLAYSPLLLVVNLIFFLVTVICILKSDDLLEIKRLSAFFLIFPVVFLIFFFPDNLTVIPSYRGMMLYFWRVFGLWVSKDLFLIGTVVISLFFLLSAMFWTLFHFFPSLVVRQAHAALSKLDFLKKTRFPRIVTLGLFVMFSFYILILVNDLRAYLVTFPSTFRERPIDVSAFHSFGIANHFFPEEIWRQIFLPLNVVFLLSLPALIRQLTKRSYGNQVAVIALFFYSIYFISALSNIKVVQLLTTSRGLFLLLPISAIFASLALSEIFKLKSIKILSVGLLFILSFGTAIFPNEAQNGRLIEAAGFYRDKVGDSNFLVLAQYTILPQEATEKYYSSSFIPTSYPVSTYAQINLAINTSCGIPASALDEIRKNSFRYLVIEEGIPKRTLFDLLKELNSKTVFDNGVKIARIR